MAHFLYTIAQRAEDFVELTHVLFAELRTAFAHLALTLIFKTFGHEFQPTFILFPLFCGLNFCRAAQFCQMAFVFVAQIVERTAAGVITQRQSHHERKE